LVSNKSSIVSALQHIQPAIAHQRAETAALKTAAQKLTQNNKTIASRRSFVNINSAQRRTQDNICLGYQYLFARRGGPPKSRAARREALKGMTESSVPPLVLRYLPGKNYSGLGVPTATLFPASE
jgi:hypothetical protein